MGQDEFSIRPTEMITIQRQDIVVSVSPNLSFSDESVSLACLRRKLLVKKILARTRVNASSSVVRSTTLLPTDDVLYDALDDVSSDDNIHDNDDDFLDRGNDNCNNIRHHKMSSVNFIIIFRRMGQFGKTYFRN